MSDQNGSFSYFYDAFGHFVEFGRWAKHFIVDTRQFGHKGLYFPFRIDQTDEFVHHLMPIEPVDGYLGDTFLIVFPSRAFNVEYGVHEKNAAYV